MSTTPDVYTSSSPSWKPSLCGPLSTLRDEPKDLRSATRPAKPGKKKTSYAPDTPDFATACQVGELKQQLVGVADELAAARTDAETKIAAAAADTESTIRRLAQEQESRLGPPLNNIYFPPQRIDHDSMLNLSTLLRGGPLRAQGRAQQRTFYTTLIPIFALFVAMVAIVVTAAQGGGEKVVVAGDPGMTWLQSWGVIAPAAISVLVMVLVVWLVIWLMTRW